MRKLNRQYKIFADTNTQVQLYIEEQPMSTRSFLQIKGTVAVTAKNNIPNNLVVELKGLYTLQTIDQTHHINQSINNLQTTNAKLSPNEKSFHQTQSNIMEGDEGIKEGTMSYQYFLEFSQQLSQLNEDNKPLAQLKSSQIPYKFPFIFILPPKMPPTIQKDMLIFGGVKVNTIYQITATNSMINCSWDLFINKNRNDLILYSPSSYHPSNQLISKTQLSNVLVFNLYKYCFCKISTYNLQLTSTIPTPQIIQIKIHLYNKGKLSTNQNDNQLFESVNVQLYGQLVGLKKICLFDKKSTLAKGQMSGYQAQMVFQIGNLHLPKSYNNQLFIMRYWFEVDIQVKKGIRLSIIQSITKDIQL